MKEEPRTTYWRSAYEELVRQTGRDLNDGYGVDPRKACPAPLHRDALQTAAAALKQAERALEEIEAIEYPAARDVDNVVQVSALVARARIIARQALSSIRQTDLAEPPDTR